MPAKVDKDACWVKILLGCGTCAEAEECSSGAITKNDKLERKEK